MKTIYFVRHCQSDNTVHEDRIRPLTAKGSQDALRVTAFFRDIPVDGVFSSPYKRAMDTVAGVAQARNLEIRTDEELRERAVGGWVEDFDAFARQQWSDTGFALPGGESLDAVMARGRAALQRLLDAPGRTLVVGSHGTALCALVHALEPAFGYEDFKRIQNVMPWIVRFDFENGRMVSRQEMIL